MPESSDPVARALASACRNRRSNRSTAPPRAASGSTSALRARFATASSRSPISCSIAARSPEARAAATSSRSSSTLARTAPRSFQSKPTRAAFSPVRSARCRDGRARGTPSIAEAPGPRSSALMRSQLRRTSPDPETNVSPKTCGWRRSILSEIARHTSSAAKAPRSLAIWAWNTTCRSKSPSSVQSSRGSSRSIASATS